MAKDVTVWCLEAPQSNFLKEVRTHGSGQRLVFTDRWDDDCLKFGMKSQAERFKKDFGLIWLEVTDHLIMNNE